MSILRLSLMLILVTLTGCSIGVKEKQTVVYAGFAKTPIELKGALRIATNKKIPITVIGVDDVVTSMDLGGMIAIKAADLKELYKSYKENKK